MERFHWIDNLRGLACILVIIVHSSIPYDINRFITPFFLSVFFVVSGYLFKKYPTKVRLKKIFNSLVVPYFIAGEFVFITGWLCIHGFNFNMHFISGFVGTFIKGRTLWFISALIVIEIAYTFIQKISINKIVLVIILASSIFFTKEMTTPWSVGQSIFCSSFFVLGDVLRIYKNKIKVNKNTIIYASIIYICVYFIWALLFGGIDRATMYNNYYPNPFQFLVLSFSSTLIIFFAFKTWLVKKIEVLDLFGRNSFWVFAFQCAILTIIKGSYLEIASTPWKCVPIILLLGVPSLIGAELLRKYMPQLCGKYEFIK